MNKSILLIDDDVDALQSLARALASHLAGIQIRTANDSETAIKIFQKQLPQVVVLDLCLSPEQGVYGGMELLKELLMQDASVRVLILTGHHDRENGYRCIQRGATSFLAKPADISHLKILILDAIEQCVMRRELAARRRQSNMQILESLIGSSPKIQTLRTQIEFAASAQQPVLLLGETGTGKGLCVQLIHALSRRCNKQLIRYQPNFTAPEMVNSDLFGHERGAFTGAAHARKGLLLEAHDGTLFLDEIDELPIESQIALLGVFQEKCFRPLGSNSDVESNFRLLTASNQPIEESVASGKIRLDFYHRIGHIEICLPPLRERICDIPKLASHFLQKANSVEQIPVFNIEPGVLQHLAQYRWPGNIREFQAVIESALYRAHFRGSTIIESCDIQIARRADRLDTHIPFYEQVRNFKARLIQSALENNDGNQIRAASTLGINRSTLRRILMETDGS